MKLHYNHRRLLPHESTTADSDYSIFAGKIEFVDYESKKVSVRDLTRDILYQYVDFLPVSGSSTTYTEEYVPEKGTICVCGNIAHGSGYVKIVILSYLTSSTTVGTLFRAARNFSSPKGLNKRVRAAYRKATPGQKVLITSDGFSEKLTKGWDRVAADLSSDKLEVNSRERIQTAGTHTVYDSSGVKFSGEANRPGSVITGVTLPDGTQRQVLYLKNNSSVDRFEDGKYNTLPIVEQLSKVQEFGLDYPVPHEILRDGLLDTILGVTANPFDKTKTTTLNGTTKDAQTPLIDQDVDHLYDKSETPIGYANNEAITYKRKGFIIEGTKGTLVGYNNWDTSTYGSILKSNIFPATKQGRFSSSTESGHTPVSRSTDEVESMLAATALMLRFPSEYNTSRLEITKEGLVLLELGSTIPKENIPIDGSTYEHPHGAGRSLEMHTTGSARIVLGKNRDEEESLDLTTLGQVVLRLGADDSSLPDSRRDVLTQIRSKNDSVGKRTFQFWKQSKLKPGDSGALSNKTGAENISLRGALDGGTVLRLGARNPASKRKHLYNGYSDAQGKTAFGVGDPNRLDSRSESRPTYGSGDSVYAFHDLTQVGVPVSPSPAPYFYSGSSITNMDAHGLSMDVHTVRDVLLRLGANPLSGNSLLLDLGGGMTAAIGSDNKGRSITAKLDGGAEITIGSNHEGRALQIEFTGDVNVFCKGNWTQHVTGDYYLEATNIFETSKINRVVKSTNVRTAALVQISNEAPDITNSNGLYSS